MNIDINEKFWETMGYFASESDFYFDRVNPVGVHDPQKYYYVWLVGGERNGEKT